MAERVAITDSLVESRIFRQRVAIAAGVVVLCALGLVVRYFQLQIVEHERYRTQSDRNRIHVQPVPPRRGLIFDRRGVLLAENRPIFNLGVTRERVGDIEAMLATVHGIIELSEEDVAGFHKRLARHLPFEPVPLRFNLSEEEIAKLAVNRYRLPGVEVEAELVRHYPYADLMAHAIGYVSRINEAELAVLDPAEYSGTHLIGKNGIEKFYEKQLHGSVGYENVETNARGRTLRVLERRDPGPGLDLTLEIDLEVQRVAYEALAGQRGAVVAINTHTGGVIAIASAPSFDPNPFVAGIGSKPYALLRDSPDHPLLNRTIQGEYPPGSTIKPMYGLAGLFYGVNTPESAVSDPGFYRLGGAGRKYRDWKKWGHGGAVDLDTAITQSCDVYYDLAHRLEIDRLHDFSVRFGLGSRTGIDQSSERPGVMPSREWKRRVLKVPWYPGETISAGIGQGYVLATPVQLAVMTATIANRGHRYRPRLIARIGDQVVDPVEDDRVEMPDPAYWDAVIAAMENVVHGPRGTAKIIAKGMAYRAAGKTGTAQVVGIADNAKYDASKLDKRQRDHALFVGFAPVDDPQIAVAVMVENGEHGSSTAAPVARRVWDAYLGYTTPVEAAPAAAPAVPAATAEPAAATDGAATPAAAAIAPAGDATAPASATVPPPATTPDARGDITTERSD